jgi:hypothetical protein
MINRFSWRSVALHAAAVEPVEEEAGKLLARAERFPEQIEMW